jgi:hypothetical protein
MVHEVHKQEYVENVYNIDKNLISIQEEQTAFKIFLINFVNNFNISTLFVSTNSLNLKVFGYLENLLLRYIFLSFEKTITFQNNMIYGTTV